MHLIDIYATIRSNVARVYMSLQICYFMMSNSETFLSKCQLFVQYTLQFKCDHFIFLKFKSFYLKFI